MKSLTSIIMVALVIIGIWTACQFTGAIYTPMRLPPIEYPVGAPMLTAAETDFELRNGRVIEGICGRYMERMIREASAMKSGDRVGSVGALLGLFVFEACKAAITMLVMAIIWAIITNWIKSHLLAFLLAALAPIVFVILVSWLTARNTALGIVRQNK